MPITTGAPTSFLPGVYVQLEQTPSPTPKVPGDIVGLVFEASRGPLNTPTWIRDINEFAALFGGRQPTVADATKLLSGYPGYRALEDNRVQDTLGVRVATSTAATAHLTLQSGANNVVTLHAGAGGGVVSPGTWANGSLAVTVAAGAAANTVDLTITNSATGEAETLVGLDYTNNATLIAAINQASSLVVASQPVLVGLTAAPTFAATLGGGTVGAGGYQAVVTLKNANGETQGSPETAVVTLTGAGQLALTVPTTSGATAWNGYITPTNGASGSETFAITSTTFGSAVSITAPWAASTVTPPVQNTAVTGAGYTAAAPTSGTYTFPTTSSSTARAGSNGEGATSAQYVGSSGTPATGLYAFAALDTEEKPNYVVLAGAASGDSTQWGAQAQAGYDNGWQAVVGFAQGTSSATAQTAWAAFTQTIAQPVALHIKCSWPWAYYYDTAYAKNYLVPSAPYFAAESAVTAENTSAANKPVAGVVQLEYVLATQSAADALANAGINALSGRITPRGVGFLTDFVGDGSDAYVQRMTAFIIASLNAAWADAQAGSDWPIDTPHMQLAQDIGNGVLDGMAAAGLIQPNPAGGAAVTPPPTTTTSGKKSASAAAGTQPSTVTPAAPTVPVYGVQIDAANNFDANGLPLSNSLIADVQVRLTKNAYNIWLRLAAGVLQDVTIGTTTT